MQLIELHPETDFAEIVEHIQLLFSELFGEGAKLAEAEVENIRTQWQMSKPSHSAYKLLNGKQTVAFFTLAESFSFFAHGRYGILNELWVSPECRGQGVGKRVLREIKNLAKEHGWQRVDVTAPPSKAWQSTFEFYQHNGFIWTGKKLKLLI